MKKLKYYSARRHWGAGCAYFGVVILFFLLGLIGGALNQQISVGLSLGIVFGGAFLVVSCVHFHKALTAGREAEKMPPCAGTVFNWEARSHFTGAIIVNHEGKEFSSPGFFTHEEAKEAVGKEICYCILNDTLFIMEIK